MFGKIQGIVDFIGDGFVILMTGAGVGYKIMLAVNRLIDLSIGDSCVFWIETIVREDAINLIGFKERAEQEMFQKLTTVSGIGAKLALAILGSFKLDVLSSAIVSGDFKTLATAPGVGKKVAERIVVELKGKVDSMYNVQCTMYNDCLGDVMAALETLGYKRGDVIELVQKLIKENEGASVQSLITLALKEISSAK